MELRTTDSRSKSYSSCWNDSRPVKEEEEEEYSGDVNKNIDDDNDVNEYDNDDKTDVSDNADNNDYDIDSDR